MGSFYVRIDKTNTITIAAIKLKFSIAQHTRDDESLPHWYTQFGFVFVFIKVLPLPLRLRRGAKSIS